jgi:hypothetical protein
MHDGSPHDVLIVCRAGDDDVGGWIAGSLVPEATVNDAALVRRSSLSGEWDELETGVEMRSLRLVATAAAVLHRGYKGFAPRYDPVSVDWVKMREYEIRRILRGVIDGNPPNRAVEMLRHLFDDLDAKDVRDRLEAIRPRPLPPRIPYD